MNQTSGRRVEGGTGYPADANLVAGPARSADVAPPQQIPRPLPAGPIAKVFGAEVVSKVVLGLSHIVVIRTLPIADFARFSYLYASAFVAVNLTGVALNRAMMVQSAQRGGAPRTPAGAVVSLVAASVVAWAVAAIGGYTHAETSAVVVFAVSYVLVDYLRSVHQSELRFREYSLIEFVRAALVTTATLFALSPMTRELDAKAAVLILGFQGAAMLLLAGPWVLWINRAKLTWRRSRHIAGWGGRISRETGALYLYIAVVGMLGQIEVFVLKRFGSEGDLAVFSAAFRYYSLLLLATGAANAVLIPLAQRAESSGSFLRLMKGGRVYFAAFAGAAILSIPVLLVLGGPLGLAKYPDFIVVYSVLCVASVQGVFLSPHVGALMRERRYRFLNVLALAVVATSLGLCVLMVHTFGAVGAAVSYCAVNLIMNWSAYCKAHRVAAA